MYMSQSNFIVNFCEIADNPKASFPSENHYYYKQNGRAPIGYKKFNRFLRQYSDGQINVKSKHITRETNTQHIYSLVSNQQKYESARAKSVKAPDLLHFPPLSTQRLPTTQKRPKPSISQRFEPFAFYCGRWDLNPHDHTTTRSLV